MNLTNLVRLCGAVAIAWTLVAMGAGMVRYQRASRPSVPQMRAISITGQALAARRDRGLSSQRLPGVEEELSPGRSDLTGRTEPFPLPGDERWGCVSVSPWRDQDGNLEAVGRWNRLDAGEGQAFCGLGLFRLSDPSIVHRIELDVVPTGKPCWVPGRPGDFLFPAGDGQLHRCHLSRERPGCSMPRTPDQSAASGENWSRAKSPRPVAWRCAPPGSGHTFI